MRAQLSAIFPKNLEVRQDGTRGKDTNFTRPTTKISKSNYNERRVLKLAFEIETKGGGQSENGEVCEMAKRVEFVLGVSGFTPHMSVRLT